VIELKTVEKGRSKWDGKVKPCVKSDLKKGIDGDDDDDTCNCNQHDLPTVESLKSWECKRISATECSCGMNCAGSDEIIPNAAYCAIERVEHDDDDDNNETDTADKRDLSIGNGHVDYSWMYSRTLPECPKAGNTTLFHSS